MSGGADSSLFFAETAEERRPRRRRWPWLVAAVVVVALVVAAGAFVQSVVREGVEAAVRQQIVARLALASDRQVDVSISEPFLVQLALGSIGEIRVTVDDVSIDGFAGDVAVVLSDVNVWGDHGIGSGVATVSMDRDQVAALLAGIDGFPADTVGLADPDVTFSTQLGAFGVTVPIGVGLTPSAAGGDIQLAPDSLRLGDLRVTADDLRARFGSFADPVLRSWTVCIADRLPSGVPLTGVEVTGERLVATFDIAERIASDPALQATGRCT